MCTQIVFDTCSFVNVICVTESSKDFNVIVDTQQVKITTVVKDEISNVIFRKKTITEDNDKLKWSKRTLTKLHDYIDKDDTDIISNYLNSEQLLSFNEITGHSGKLNGELASSILCLYLSRLNKMKTVFVTDDYKAIDAFRSYFSYQQVGEVIDTADYLIWQYWLGKIRTLKDLRSCLVNLRKEYSKDNNSVIKELEDLHRKCKSNSQESKVAMLITDIISAINKSNHVEIKSLDTKIQTIGGTLAKQVSHKLNCLSLNGSHKQVNKISTCLKLIDNHDILQS